MEGGMLLDAYTCTYYSSPSPHSEIHDFCHCLIIAMADAQKFFPQVLCKSPIYIYTSEESFRQAFWSGVIFYLYIHCMRKLHSFNFSIQTFIKQKMQRHYTCTALICKIQIPAGRPYNRTNCTALIWLYCTDVLVAFHCAIWQYVVIAE